MISRSSTSLLLLSWASLVSASPLLDRRQFESTTSSSTLLVSSTQPADPAPSSQFSSTTDSSSSSPTASSPPSHLAIATSIGIAVFIVLGAVGLFFLSRSCMRRAKRKSEFYWAEKSIGSEEQVHEERAEGRKTPSRAKEDEGKSLVSVDSAQSSPVLFSQTPYNPPSPPPRSYRSSSHRASSAHSRYTSFDSSLNHPPMQTVSQYADNMDLANVKERIDE